jgi:hypothetical protein
MSRVFEQCTGRAPNFPQSEHPATSNTLITGSTIRLPGKHAKVNRDGYFGHRRGGPALHIRWTAGSRSGRDLDLNPALSVAANCRRRVKTDPLSTAES